MAQVSEGRASPRRQGPSSVRFKNSSQLHPSHLSLPPAPHLVHLSFLICKMGLILTCLISSEAQISGNKSKLCHNITGGEENFALSTPVHLSFHLSLTANPEKIPGLTEEELVMAQRD